MKIPVTELLCGQYLRSKVPKSFEGFEIIFR